MYICLCNNVNDTQIRDAVAQGASSLDDLRATLGVASQCGQCACMAEEVLECEQQRLSLYRNAAQPHNTAASNAN
jgi:bacterioferritin-associated ferredoxin